MTECASVGLRGVRVFNPRILRKAYDFDVIALRRIALVAGLALACVTRAAAVNLDVTPQDIARALSIGRSTDRERAQFHAPYVQSLNQPFIQTVEVVTEFRRFVRTTEERTLKGDRAFGHSVGLAQQAVAPWKHRLSVVARLRFHPQNNYVDVPRAEIALVDDDRALIGVLKEPVLSLPSSQPGDRLPVLGALVEGVFDAVAVGQSVREFVIRLEGKELARVKFDLSKLE